MESNGVVSAGIEQLKHLEGEGDAAIDGMMRISIHGTTGTFFGANITFSARCEIQDDCKFSEAYGQCAI